MRLRSGTYHAQSRRSENGSGCRHPKHPAQARTLAETRQLSFSRQAGRQQKGSQQGLQRVSVNMDEGSAYTAEYCADDSVYQQQGCSGYSSNMDAAVQFTASSAAEGALAGDHVCSAQLRMVPRQSPARQAKRVGAWMGLLRCQWAPWPQVSQDAVPRHGWAT